MNLALKPMPLAAMVGLRIMYAHAGLFQAIHFCIPPSLSLSLSLLPGGAHEGLLQDGPIENLVPKAQ